MNREIKFRGKSLDDGEWIYGYYGYKDLTDEHFIIAPTLGSDLPQYFTDYLVDGESVGEFTGLKDKNGVEIYEGDIVRVHEGKDFTWDHPVEYWRGGFWVTDENCIGAIHTFCEVIGNIYENKPLLNE